jgi:cell division septum initiation protein DivIVA
VKKDVQVYRLTNGGTFCLGNIVLRFATSTAFAVGTSYYLMPNTTRNIGQHLDRLERKFPPLYDAHQQLNEAFGDARKQVDDTVAQLTGAASDATSQISSKAKQLESDISSKAKQLESDISSKANTQTSKLESTASEAREKFDEVKEKVENMYSTRVKVKIERCNISSYR